MCLRMRWLGTYFIIFAGQCSFHWLLFCSMLTRCIHPTVVVVLPAGRPDWSLPGTGTQRWTGWCRGSCGWCCGRSGGRGRSRKWRGWWAGRRATAECRPKWWHPEACRGRGLCSARGMIRRSHKHHPDRLMKHTGNGQKKKTGMTTSSKTFPIWLGCSRKKKHACAPPVLICKTIINNENERNTFKRTLNPNHQCFLPTSPKLWLFHLWLFFFWSKCIWSAFKHATAQRATGGRYESWISQCESI